MSVSEAEQLESPPEGEALLDVELRDVRIPTDDEDVTLAADLYLPVGAEPVPALVTVLPYRKDGPLGVALAPTMRWFAARGYASLLVDFRGTGSSDGTQRPPFDPAEADDGVAAVEWAATQPWSSGSVGMWGHSYGAIMALRTAARKPPHLKAILPIMGALDIERDLVHPGGQRGCFTAVASWGLQTLLNQLLPPLEEHATEAQQLRWRRRLHESEPWLLDLFRHGPGHPTWKARAIDAARIEIPTFCIAGWRDWFCDATIRAYECIAGPKKLLVGPWGHSLPDVTPIEPIHYQTLALRWWDHWLNETPNGVMSEPEVLIFEQGPRPAWRALPSWPVPARSRRLATRGTSLDLQPLDPAGETPIDGRVETILVRHVPDATVGALSGSWGLGVDPLGRPLDQHDDDMRSICATSAPLAEDMVIAGRPSTTLLLAERTTVERIVARLADVDPDGRSTAITAGVASRDAAADSCTVTLTPTLYRISAGHRLRVAVSSSDFPSLWPESGNGRPPVLELNRIDLVLPVAAHEAGDLHMPPASSGVDSALATLWVGQENTCELARDALNGTIRARVGTASTVYTRDRAHLLHSKVELTVTAANRAPGAMNVRGTATGTVWMNDGQEIVAHAKLHLTQHSLSVTGSIDIDGVRTFSRRWSA